ncbi:MAG: hypothetical protein ACK40I_06365 [Tabrizicola sp.]
MRYGQSGTLVLVARTLWSLMGLGLRQIEAASVWQILFWRSAGMGPALLAPLCVFVFLGETASAATFAGGGVLLAAVALKAVMGARAQMAQGLAKAP